MSKSKHQEVSVPGVEVEGPDAHSGHVGVILLPDVEVDLHWEGGIEIGSVKWAVHNLLGSVQDKREVFLGIGLRKRYQFQVDDVGLEE